MLLKQVSPLLRRNVEFISFFRCHSVALSDKNRQRCLEYIDTHLAKRDDSGFIQTLLKARMKPTRIKKRSGVLVSLCEVDGRESMLFTLRTHHLPSHKGQVSYPGGGVKSEDNGSVVEAALRETEEEIGIDRRKIDVWSTLPPIVDQGMTTLVYPVIGNLGKISLSDLKYCTSEVAEAFTLPLDFLCDARNVRYTRYRIHYEKSSPHDYVMPVFLSPHRIWGLTAIACNVTLGILLPHAHVWTVGQRFPK